MSDRTEIGFVGLGVTGYPMAGHLAAAERAEFVIQRLRRGERR